MSSRRRTLTITVLAIAAFLVLGRGISAIYVDYQWYAAMHATEVWSARLSNLVLLTVAIATGASLFVLANLYIVRQSIVSIVLPRQMANLEIGEEVPSRYLTAATVAAAVVLGTLLALPPEPWTELAQARYGIAFGDGDPYLQSDLGFYVYWLPLENALFLRALLVLVTTIVVVLVLYAAVTPGLRWDRARFHVTAHVRRHAALLLPFVFAMLAWYYRLDAYAVLTRGGGGGPGTAFSYAEHQVTLPADRLLALLLLAAGVVAGAALWRGQSRTTLAVLLSSLALIGIAHGIEPLVSHAPTAAEAARREQTYSIIRSQATRSAFSVERLRTTRNLDSVPVRYQSLAAAAPNVSSWDPAALALAVERTRRRSAGGGGGGGMGVISAAGWRWSESGLLALAIQTDGGSTDADATLASPEPGAVVPVRATLVADAGAPLVTDLSGHLSTESVRLPPILVFAGAVGAAIVADSLDRVAAPRVDGFGARLAQAWSAQQLSLLSVELPTPRPKLITRRDVHDRLDALVPFFVQGTTAWPALWADSLYWIVDLYSAADLYPLSEHLYVADDHRSYFQHAATAFVQAHTGRVLLVADSVRDPIAETWIRRFPHLFVRWPAVPKELALLAPPAVDAALATAQAFAVAAGKGAQPPDDSHLAPVHMAPSDRADSVLASGEPPCLAAGGGGRGGPTDGPCAWSVPLVDAGDRVVGLVVATGGIDRKLLWVPLDSGGPRWAAAIEKLQRESDSVVARQRESSTARGRVRAFVVGHQLALVQPEYAWHADAAPSLLSTAVAMGESAWGGETLSDAIGAQVGATGGHDSGLAVSPAFRARVTALYEAMQAALRRGDLAGFGSAYAEMGRLLGRTSSAPVPGSRQP